MKSNYSTAEIYLQDIDYKEQNTKFKTRELKKRSCGYMVQCGKTKSYTKVYPSVRYSFLNADVKEEKIQLLCFKRCIKFYIILPILASFNHGVCEILYTCII